MRLRNLAREILNNCFHLCHQFSESIEVDFLDDIDFFTINLVHLWPASQYLQFIHSQNEKRVDFSVDFFLRPMRRRVPCPSLYTPLFESRDYSRTDFFSGCIGSGPHVGICYMHIQFNSIYLFRKHVYIHRKNTVYVICIFNSIQYIYF